MVSLKWHTEQRKIKDLKLNELNPRTISDVNFKKLNDSIDKFDLVEIPVINADNTVIAGHQRIKTYIAKNLLEELIEVRVPNRQLTDQELKEYMLLSNNHSGEWDFSKLEANFKDINTIDLGIKISEWDSWRRQVQQDLAKQSQDDGYEFEINDVQTDIKLGDKILIGKHILVCGSATSPVAWNLLMNKELADLIITDPPYNVDYVGKTKNALKIQGDKQSDSGFYNFLLDFYRNAYQNMKKGAACYVWHADSEGANFRRAMADAGIMVKQCLIWVKNSMVMGRQDYQWKHEPCLYGWKEGASHNWYSDRKQTTILNFDRPMRNAEHPTMKPVPLISYQMVNSSKENDIVVDPFGGSGTTMVSAEKMSRRCRMIELDPKYCQVIVNRMKALNPNIEVIIHSAEA